ncbi:hypothetical protein FQN54_009813 [Arachnomyces sp. PD_36]|nr:hypothetical protein FQN54_009813 [Arachnomyces sp. PD_36]
MRSSSTFDSFEYDDEYEYDDHDCEQTEWPTILDHRRIRKALVTVIWVALVLGALHVLAIIGILVAFLVKDQTPIDSQFPFYKNTRFAECAAVPPDLNVCSAIAASWTEGGSGKRFSYYQDLGRNYILEPETTTTAEISYDWCQMMSCFNDYKVIPSSVNDPAMGLTSLSGWWYAAFSITSALWSFIRSCPAFRRSYKDPPSCKGIGSMGVIDWVFFAWDLCGPLVWWWVSFALLIINPEPSPSLSLLAWATAWKLSSTLQYYPQSCMFARLPRLGRALPWVFGFLAVAQWAATIYVIQGGGEGNSSETIYPSYSCLASQVSSGPGTSSCSAEEICSKDWLFSGPNFPIPGDQGEGLPFGLFILMTTAAGSAVAISWLVSIDVGGRSFKENYSMWAPTINLALVGALSILIITPMVGKFFGTEWSQRQRDAVVSWDDDCRAVHVGLSPWRFYLDVNIYARPLHVAKMWFGV